MDDEDWDSEGVGVEVVWMGGGGFGELGLGVDGLVGL